MVFWVVTAALCGVVVVLMARAVLHARASEGSEAEYDLQIYRDQLAEVERDLARKVLTEEEAEQIRTEVSRRILDADRKRQGEMETAQTGRANGPMIAMLAAATVGVSYWTYLSLGAPGYGDLPHQLRLEMAQDVRENRPSQADAEAQAGLQPPPTAGQDPAYLELMERLREAMAERPNDVRGLRLLASNEASLGNFRAAHQVQAQLIRALGDLAEAEDYANLADMLVLAAGGYVSPEAEQALTRALQLDPTNGAARYYSGQLYSQIGRPDLAFKLWEQLLLEGPDDAIWIAPIRAQIEDLALRAGIAFELEPEAAPRGPSAEDVANAADMTPEERQAMIEGMVAGLSDRLANDGGTPTEWGQLIRALGALGNDDQAKAIYAEAQIVFQGNRSALATIRQAANAAGLIE
ncbi:MAG: c-type cytochrome biogenesis protein CcmI [Pseudomonadota bacterium]